MRHHALTPLIAALAAGLAPGAEPPAPRPLAWPAGPMEVRVAFPRPIDPAGVAGLAGRTIPFGEPPGGGGGGAIGAIRIAGAKLADGGRTLILFTDPHSRRATYTLDLPGLRAAGGPAGGEAVRLDYDLSGVAVTWDDGKAGATPAWSGWWPALDVEAARALAARSVEHGRLIPLLSRPGRLSLGTRAILPAGKATLTLEASGPIVEASVGGLAADDEGKARVALESESESTGEPAELALALRTGVGAAPLTLRASYRAGADPADRPLPAGRLMLPWAPSAPPAAAPAAPPFDLAGGDPGRGEAVFFGEEGKCATCHKARGRGGEVGPGLDAQAGRDRAAVYRDINEPSAVIHPDYQPYTVALKDGRVAVGVVRAEGADGVKVVDNGAKATTFPRAEVEELRPSGTSIMPVGLAGALGEARMRDLIAFLTAPAAGPKD